MKRKEKPVEKSIAQQLISALRKIEPYFQLFTIPLILLLILLIVQLVGDNIQKEIERDDVHAFTTMLPVHPYPILKTVYTPAISAESAIIMENSSKGILYQKNPTFRFSMASTTKIMTALTAIEAFNPDDILTVRRKGVEGTVLGLVPGEQLTFEPLLYAMLLPSANDAAFAIADNYPGGEKAFVTAMNRKAKEYYLTNTHYGDPAGLNDDEDYTTVFDLAQLTSHALKEPLLVKIVMTQNKEITSLVGKPYFLENLNKLLGTNGVTGFKTGQTTGAGGVLVTTAVKNNRTFIIVVMRSLDRFADTAILLQLINDNVKYFSPSVLSP